jgi:chromosome partitioning protein
MGKVITLGLQKGGVSKSTTTGVLAYLLSKDNFKTLTIDFDSQGNLTELLTNKPANEFRYNTIFQAIATKEPRKYIYEVSENLHIIPANNLLSLFPKWIYTKSMVNEENIYGVTVDYEGSPVAQLDIMLNEIRDEYDFILIDTPPSLSEHTTNALVASDYVIVMYEASKFCYSAIPNFMDTVEISRKSSRHEVEILGILRTLNDKRRTDSRMFNQYIEDDYPSLVFNTVITRKASTGRLPYYGLEDNEELNEAVSQYQDFYLEVIQRMEEGENNE